MTATHSSSARRAAIVETPAPSLFILDDDVGFVHAAAELARAHGWDITIAGTLEQGRARLAAAQFDLALLDLNLPDGDGLALIDAIDPVRTQVVLCTGRPTVDSALKALHVPVVDYLVKPLHASQFTALLETAERRRPAPAASEPPREELPSETADTITFAVGTPLHEVERRMLFKTLAYFDNNKSRAAQALGITTKTIYNRLHAYRSAGTPAIGDERAGERHGIDHDDA